ncbi:hypothetical protein H1P_6080001 [Hyella patelloides LEGE 07179]|uniref:DUF4347 domain-containing protein n=1 Tax=Hyella patelloides LEGE 07179 TaxID=945734 RepID=A0A563W1B0_9CYAN|nr:DUF4347 domain-containing protein [Hyella patelloides]VEP17446.1 hypothetical protein H1P_6080001 [Hyella patelloides LEGE 07179]
MNICENDQSNNILSSLNSALSWEGETTSYGLETADTTSNYEPGLHLIFDENLGREIVDSSQLNQDNNSRKSLVFIDSAVQDSQTLIDNISGATEIVILDEDKDELVQISSHLNEYQQLDAVHIVSHGESGQLSFANSKLNSDTLQQYDSLLENWRSSLDIEADLVLYGCDIASGEKGNSFLQELSQISSADILASADKTGSRGDWELETALGEVEAVSIFNSAIETAYQHTLDFGDITITPGTLPDFGNVDFNDTNFDFSSVAADDLVLFADAGLDFGTLNPDAISQIDFNSIPAEDLSILADAGLRLEPLDSEAISALSLNFHRLPIHSRRN